MFNVYLLVVRFEGNPPVTGGFPAQKASDDGSSNISHEKGKMDQTRQNKRSDSFCLCMIPFDRLFFAHTDWAKMLSVIKMIYSMRQKTIHLDMPTLIWFLVGYVRFILSLSKKDTYPKETQKKKRTLAWPCSHLDFRTSSIAVSDWPTVDIIPRSQWYDYVWQLF